MKFEGICPEGIAEIWTEFIKSADMLRTKFSLSLKSRLGEVFSSQNRTFSLHFKGTNQNLLPELFDLRKPITTLHLSDIVPT